MNEWFDDFAETVAKHVSRAWFFTFCVLLIVIWLPTIFLLSFDTSQLLINTATTIITFLLVALLENTQDRTAKAQNHKLDVIMEGLAEVLDDSSPTTEKLREMSGTEMESSK